MEIVVEGEVRNHGPGPCGSAFCGLVRDRTSRQNQSVGRNIDDAPKPIDPTI